LAQDVPLTEGLGVTAGSANDLVAKRSLQLEAAGGVGTLLDEFARTAINPLPTVLEAQPNNSGDDFATGSNMEHHALGRFVATEIEFN
jgi:hypothetical protein